MHDEKHGCRRPAVADLFYPGEPAALRRDVDQYLDAASADGPAPKALIAPHAGYVYSGPVAAYAYATLAAVADRIRRVVLLGPAHRVLVRGLALSNAEEFATPLGRIPIDLTHQALLADLPFVAANDEAHAYEHSLEVHLPFLQRVLKTFTIVPIVVGFAPAEDVAMALSCIGGGPDTLIIVSSDLSHYHDYLAAQRLDAGTTRDIEALHSDITSEQACGCMPINGLMRWAKSRGLVVTTLDLRNSGDTAGPRDRVVGYGAYALH
jgi:AmmeMemoRadiSam system protein B